MRIIYLLLVLTFSLASFGQSKNPFNKLKFDKVVFYDFEDVGEKGAYIVNENGKNIQTIKKQIKLDSATVKKLNSKLGDKKSFGKQPASCFEPHCGFVYFLKDKPVAQITICFSCNRLYSSIVIPAQKQGKQGKGKEAYYIFNGLSKSFRLFLNSLLVMHKFSNQIEPGSSFDE
jgi:hypothetical protein